MSAENSLTFEIAEKISEFFIELLNIVSSQKEGQYALFNRERIAQNLIIRENVVNKYGRVSTTAPLVYLNEAFEDELFSYVFLYGLDTEFFQVFRSRPLFHYTTITIMFRILQNQTIRMSGLAGLNDRSELDLRFFNTVDAPYQPRKLPRHLIARANKTFVLSCSTKGDDLNQWRLYGDDGKGACLQFNVRRNALPTQDFALGKVAYGSSPIEARMRLQDYIWQTYHRKLIFSRMRDYRNFIKIEDYRDEAEVRLVCKPSSAVTMNWAPNRYQLINSFIEFNPFGVDFPLELTGILLGPKCFDKDINASQLEYFIRLRGNRKVLPRNLIIDCSRKDHYR
jgi:hypothetical protein